MTASVRKLLSASLLLAVAVSFAAITQAADKATIQDQAQDRGLAHDILKQAVDTRTVAGASQVPVLAKALADRFRAAGFADSDIQVLPLNNGKEELAALIVRYRGTESGKRKPILLMGHMDVVDVVPQAWTTDPFSLTEKDGYFYGRGALDNKGSISTISTAFISLKKSGWRPKRDLIIAFSGDEETGMTTSRALIANPWIAGAEYALNGDAGLGTAVKDGVPPTFSVQLAEKTVVTFELSAKNAGGHSSLPRDDNAIFDIADVIKAVQGLSFPISWTPISRSMADNIIKERGGEVGVAVSTLLTNPADADAIRAVSKFPDVSSILRTTCVPTVITGGGAINALPQRVVLTVNCRVLPGVPVEDIKGKLRDAVNNPAIEINQVGEAIESPASPINPSLLAAIGRAVHVEYPGAPVQVMMSSGGTDGREYRRKGIPTYGAGSIVLSPVDFMRVHGSNERVATEAFYKDVTFWKTLLVEVGR